MLTGLFVLSGVLTLMILMFVILTYNALHFDEDEFSDIDYKGDDRK